MYPRISLSTSRSPAGLARVGLHLVALLSITLGGCRQQAADATAVAYVAPATANLRRELTEKNSTVAVLKHGDPVRLLEIRRRFILVRSAAGVQGWLDASVLLTREQMKRIRQDTERALQMPSEGSAGVYEALNVHIEPSRLSPAFTQIPEGGSVDVLAQKLEPKASGPTRVSTSPFQSALAPPQPVRSEKKSRAIPKLPPRPTAPKPPADWLALSGHADLASAERSAQGAVSAERKPESQNREPAKPEVLESWTLIRTKDKLCGWVLSRNLVMSIPDEVAQYAEGRRITSYFDLGAVLDEQKGPKHNWLWTTASEAERFDFDSWRVFLWNRRRHRYETSYRQREVEGYFPVIVDPPDGAESGRTFHLILKNDDGHTVLKSYSFDGVRIRLTGTEPYGGGHLPSSADHVDETSTEVSKPATKPNWLNQQLDKLRREFRKSG